MIQTTDITLEEFFRLIGITDLQPWKMQIMKNLLALKSAGLCHTESDVKRGITFLAQTQPRPKAKALPKPQPEKYAPETRSLPAPHPVVMLVDEIAATEKVAGSGKEPKAERAEK